METTFAATSTRTRPLPQKTGIDEQQHVAVTPKERLHTVEEFVEKLEQAVLERL